MFLGCGVGGHRLHSTVTMPASSLLVSLQNHLWQIGNFIIEQPHSQDAFKLHDSGITAFFSILPGPCRLPEAMENGEEFLLSTSTEVGFLLKWKR